MIEYFEPFDCHFEVFKNPSMVFDAIYKKIYDVVVLSLESPDFEALELTRQIRENKIRVPIILLSRYVDFDYVRRGYAYGCSDYVREPLEFEELRYRILQSARHCHFDTNENIIYLKNKFVYDLNKYCLSKNNLLISLTAKENKIIQYLIKKIGQCCSVEEIAESLSEEKFVNSSSVRMHIKRIREKCGKNLIESTKGVGYCIQRDKAE